MVLLSKLLRNIGPRVYAMLRLLWATIIMARYKKICCTNTAQRSNETEGKQGLRGCKMHPNSPKWVQSSLVSKSTGLAT